MTALDDMLLRLCDMEKDVVPGSDAVPAAFYSQEGQPFWTNDARNFEVQLVAEDLQVVTYHVTATLALGPVSAGFEQEAEQQTYQWIYTVPQYINQRRQLKRTSADSPVAYLDPRGAFCSGGTKRDDIASGIGQLMFGIDFNIDVPMWQETDQVVF
jgi:hypothetical protein